MRPDRDNSHPPAGSVEHLLSFDVEEYFQVEAAARVRREQWDSYPKRLAPHVDRILQLLADHGASATFFVLGWVARHERPVVSRIAAAGHEIASHGMRHHMLEHLAPDAFARELSDSRKLLEDISSRPVVGHRAPTFSLTHRTAWALDVLAEAGFAYDSSVFPIRHDRYGVPDAPRFRHWAVGPGGGRILEIPPLTLRVMGANWPVGGGGYLRLLPARVVGSALAGAGRLGQPGMIYLHPWELDDDQPVLPMSRLGRVRHRLGLRHTAAKLRWLLKRFRFVSVYHCREDLATTTGSSYVYGRRLAGHQDGRRGRQ